MYFLFHFRTNKKKNVCFVTQIQLKAKNIAPTVYAFRHSFCTICITSQFVCMNSGVCFCEFVFFHLFQVFLSFFFFFFLFFSWTFSHNESEILLGTRVKKKNVITKYSVFFFNFNRFGELLICADFSTLCDGLTHWVFLAFSVTRV